MTKKKLTSALTILTATFGLSYLPTIGTASAQVGDLNCTMSGTNTFTPALQPGGTSTVGKFDAQLTDCISLNGRFPQLHSGQFKIERTGTVTSAPAPNPCSLLFTISDATAIIYWDNGTESSVAITANTNPDMGTINIGFTYNDPKDPLFGDAAHFVGAPIPNADCAISGLNTWTLPAGDEISY